MDSVKIYCKPKTGLEKLQHSSFMKSKTNKGPFRLPYGGSKSCAFDLVYF